MCKCGYCVIVLIVQLVKPITLHSGLHMYRIIVGAVRPDLALREYDGFTSGSKQSSVINKSALAVNKFAIYAGWRVEP